MEYFLLADLFSPKTMSHIIIKSTGEAIGTIEGKNNGYCASCFLTKNSTFVTEKKMAEVFVLENYKKKLTGISKSGKSFDYQLVLF